MSTATHPTDDLVIRTRRLLVRRFRPDDWRDLHAYLSLPETYAFEPGEPIDEAAARALAEDRARGTAFRAIQLAPDGPMVGHLSFGQVEPEALRTWELGFIVNPAHQRQGFASEAARGLVEHAFQEIGAHRVVAECHPDNVASWRTLERVGFRREGHLRRNIFFRRGADGLPAWQDTFVYGLLAGDLEPG